MVRVNECAVCTSENKTDFQFQEFYSDQNPDLCLNKKELLGRMKKSVIKKVYLTTDSTLVQYTRVTACRHWQCRSIVDLRSPHRTIGRIDRLAIGNSVNNLGNLVIAKDVIATKSKRTSDNATLPSI